jgi:hypothetical protein
MKAADTANPSTSTSPVTLEQAQQTTLLNLSHPLRLPNKNATDSLAAEGPAQDNSRNWNTEGAGDTAATESVLVTHKPSHGAQSTQAAAHPVCAAGGVPASGSAPNLNALTQDELRASNDRVTSLVSCLNASPSNAKVMSALKQLASQVPGLAGHLKHLDAHFATSMSTGVAVAPPPTRTGAVPAVASACAAPVTTGDRPLRTNSSSGAAKRVLPTCSAEVTSPKKACIHRSSVLSEILARQRAAEEASQSCEPTLQAVTNLTDLSRLVRKRASSESAGVPPAEALVANPLSQPMSEKAAVLTTSSMHNSMHNSTRARSGLQEATPALHYDAASHSTQNNPVAGTSAPPVAATTNAGLNSLLSALAARRCTSPQAFLQEVLELHANATKSIPSTIPSSTAPSTAPLAESCSTGALPQAQSAAVRGVHLSGEGGASSAPLHRSAGGSGSGSGSHTSLEHQRSNASGPSAPSMHAALAGLAHSQMLRSIQQQQQHTGHRQNFGEVSDLRSQLSGGLSSMRALFSTESPPELLTTQDLSSRIPWQQQHHHHQQQPQQQQRQPQQQQHQPQPQRTALSVVGNGENGTLTARLISEFSRGPYVDPAAAAQAVAAILQQQKAPLSDIAAVLAAPEMVLNTLLQLGAGRAASPHQVPPAPPSSRPQLVPTVPLHCEDGPTVSLADVLAEDVSEPEAVKCEAVDGAATQVLYLFATCHPPLKFFLKPLPARYCRQCPPVPLHVVYHYLTVYMSHRPVEWTLNGVITTLKSKPARVWAAYCACLNILLPNRD